jgi:hypothetical protein
VVWVVLLLLLLVVGGVVGVEVLGAARRGRAGQRVGGVKRSLLLHRQLG